MTFLAFAWLTAAMFSAMLVATSALGMYEGILIAELIALGIVVATIIGVRRGADPTELQRRIERRHRERRGF